jgi:hypothetical protein
MTLFYDFRAIPLLGDLRFRMKRLAHGAVLVAFMPAAWSTFRQDFVTLALKPRGFGKRSIQPHLRVQYDMDWHGLQ